MRSDGTDLAKLTCNAPSGQDPGAYQPDWSPDGRQIAFDLYGDIDVMTPAGADMHKVATGSGTVVLARWLAARVCRAAVRLQPGHPHPHLGLGRRRAADVRLRRCTGLVAGWERPSSSPTRIDPARNWVLQTIGADGRGLRTIVDTVNPTSVDWAADTSDTASEPDVTAADTSCAETASAAAPAAPPSTGRRAVAADGHRAGSDDACPRHPSNGRTGCDSPTSRSVRACCAPGGRSS